MDYKQYVFYFSAKREILQDERFELFGEMDIFSSTDSESKSYPMKFYMDKIDRLKTLSVAIVGEDEENITVKVFIPFDQNSTESDPYYDALLADWTTRGLVESIEEPDDQLIKNINLA